MATPKRIYLIDGSGYIFRAFFALPPLTDPQGVPVGAVFGFCNMLFRLVQDRPGDQLLVVNTQFNTRGGAATTRPFTRLGASPVTIEGIERRVTFDGENAHSNTAPRTPSSRRSGISAWPP